MVEVADIGIRLFFPEHPGQQHQLIILHPHNVVVFYK
ncbi:hypothetical protein SDC9_206897 [bioreactor metagenome]|uniref:Uncharacterized protein n=1 Tax=bioreactor metagenome TaxID=1076179 RepID=A0A645J700_9ZZZZ